MTLRLEIKHWQTLAAITEVGSMSGAAERLGTTQSALSHRLAEAERRLGSRLFDRSRQRRLHPTPGGQALYQTALRVLAELERAEADFRRSSGAVAHVVRFGIAAYSCYHWFPRFLARVREALPEIQVELVAAATQRPVKSLLDGAVDLVIAPAHQARPGVEALALFDDELVLILPPGHRLARRDWIRASDLVEETYLTYSRTPEPGFEYDRFVRPAGVQPRVLSFVEQTDAIAELVAAGFGVSILSRWAQDWARA